MRISETMDVSVSVNSTALNKHQLLAFLFSGETLYKGIISLAVTAALYDGNKG